MRARWIFFLTGWVTVLSLSLPSALAHHGWSGNTIEFELTGTVVTPVSLSGPHATMQVRDTEGQLWDVTLAPAPRTHRAGLTEDVLPEGAEVRLVGQRNSDQSSFEIKTRQVIWNDRTFDVYPPARR